LTLLPECAIIIMSRDERQEKGEQNNVDNLLVGN
jgi:hypothetical protein